MLTSEQAQEWEINLYLLDIIRTFRIKRPNPISRDAAIALAKAALESEEGRIIIKAIKSRAIS
jgi:hypothetical protein